MNNKTIRVFQTACAIPAVVTLAACGGGSSSKASQPGSVAGTSPSSANSAHPSPSNTSGAPSATSATSHGVDATVQTVQTAEAPANCDMPSVRLVGGKTPASLHPREGGSDLYSAVRPVLVDMTGAGSKQVLWRYGCTAGGVNWPEILVLSDSKGNLVGSFDLGDVAHTEHADVSGWSVKGRDVAVDWKQYEGAGFEVKDHHSVLSWGNGKLQLKDDGSPASSGSQANANVPDGAASGAGGPRPSNATPLTEKAHEQYVSELAFQSPSGKNGCMVSSAWIRCGTSAGPETFLDPAGTVMNSKPADDAPAWLDADKLAYGQVRYYQDTVFASTDQGVTVWNTKTGHGAFINTSGVQEF